jgi:choline dehydrogenase-like flavoprotein
MPEPIKADFRFCWRTRQEPHRHPVAGAVLGKVCSLHGQVIDHPGLYVVDGAFVPGGTVGDVNPSFTIAALAERSVESIIAKNIMDKSPDDESLAIFKQRG